MIRDNTRARAARRQNTEGRPENEMAIIVLGRIDAISDILPEPGDQRTCARKNALRQIGKIVLPICWKTKQVKGRLNDNVLYTS